MKTEFPFVLQLSICCLLALGGCSTPERKITPLELSLYSPVQLCGKDYDVDGLRLNLLYATNRNVTGCDLGIFQANCTGNMTGLQVMGIGSSTQNMTGLQVGLASATQEDITGVQLGAYGYCHGTMDGLQQGLLFVTCGKGDGVQVCALESLSADRMSGLQIAGWISSADGTVHGAQFATFTGCEDLFGTQVGIGMNECGGLRGMQAAGLGSLCFGEMRGVQISGLFNFTRGGRKEGEKDPDARMCGLQISSLFNQCDRVRGVQVAGLINRSRIDVAGVQIGGILNLSEQEEQAIAASRMRGVQIGLINSAERNDGVQIGLLNFSRNGGFRFCPLINCGFFSP